MSVLIKGMEMPKSCCQCPCSNVAGCEVTREVLTSNLMRTGRSKRCPLVPVPPHGRLIDASEEITVQMYDDQHEDFYQVKMTIDDLLSQSWIDAKAPTVIPAEEGE